MPKNDFEVKLKITPELKERLDELQELAEGLRIKYARALAQTAVGIENAKRELRAVIANLDAIQFPLAQVGEEQKEGDDAADQDQHGGRAHHRDPGESSST